MTLLEKILDEYPEEGFLKADGLDEFNIECAYVGERTPIFIKLIN
jgi:hypothetical protein